MIPLIPMVISAIPSIIDLFTGDNKTKAVIDLAKTAGKALGMKEEPTPEAVIQHLSDNPDAVIKLKEIEHKGKVLQLEELKEKNRALEDVVAESNRHDESNRNKAHESYQTKGDKADEIAQRIIVANLPIIALLVLGNLALIYWMKTEVALLAIASNIIGITIANLFAERQAVVNFFFGSSIGSKQKSDKLNNIMNKKES